ncbi:hypothetical protein GCM10009672_05770 [Nesterenkonia lutea]
MSTRLRIGSWTAILGVAALTIGSLNQSPEPTEAAWTDSEYAAAELRYEGDGTDEDPAPEGVSYQLVSVTQYVPAPDFCQNFTLTNATAEAVEWEYSFDTSKAPFWGWTPYDSDGSPKFDIHGEGRWTGDFDSTSSIWTIRGKDFQDWRGDTRFMAANETRSLSFCTHTGTVPYPSVDPTLFTWDLDVRESDWQIALHATVETESEYYIPFGITVDLAEIVCPDVIDDVKIVWWPDNVPPPTKAGHVYSYNLPSGNWAALIRSGHAFTHDIARLDLGTERDIRNHLQPDC